MRFFKIAHYGGYFLHSLDMYSRAQLKPRRAGLLRSQSRHIYHMSEELLRLEARHVDCWRRLRDASRISRELTALREAGRVA